MNLEDLSVVEAAAAIRQGELSPVAYTEALLDRIDAVEPRVKAWTTIDRNAVIAEAREREAEARAGNFRGALHGVPIGIKDIFDTRGLRTTRGSRIFENFVPDVDAAAVRKLRRAGAIVLGKTVTTEFAYLDPGPTRNPWNTAHTPGGSSSGSAAAVAARMCPATIGSQTVGSINRPAAYNGVVALMPTQRRISRAGSFPDAWSLDHVGPFACSVADVAAMTAAMSDTPIGVAGTPKPLRIGVFRGYFLDNATDESRVHYEQLIVRLTGAGFDVREPGLPEIFSFGSATLRIILRAEMAAVHQSLFETHREMYGPKIRAVIETGLLLDASDYLRARRVRRIYQREMESLFDQLDVVISPGARGTAPEGMGTGDSVMQLPWAVADFPTLSLPHAVAADGLPLGIQITAAPMQEAKLLAAGQAIEQIIAFRERPGI